MVNVKYVLSRGRLFNAYARVQEQEINTKDALKRKEKNLEKKQAMSNTC